MESWPPRWLTPVDPDAPSRGGEAVEFIETFCRITKDSVAGPVGSSLRLREWQRRFLHGLLVERPDGRLKHRLALAGIARKNGKSALGAGIALWGLVLGDQGGEVYSCAGDREQARIVFGTAKRMVEMDPELSGLLKVYRDVIEVPSTGSVYRCLSAEAYTKEGLNPHLVLFDELHVQPNRELFDVMQLASGARREPLMVCITTAGVRTDQTGGDSICYQLYQYGQRVASGEVDDPSFFFAWWEPELAEKADHTDPDVWAEANPGIGDIVALEDFEAAVKKTPESEFRTKRTNVFVAGASSWLLHGAWDACVGDGEPPDGADVVLAVDGSFSNDSTGIVGCTVGGVPHLFVVGKWERDPDDLHWRVPMEEVENKVRAACRRWSVREVTFDPYRWQRSMQVLEDEGLPVTEFPQTPARMVPACALLRDAVVEQRVTHDGDESLSRHVRNAVVKVDRLGPRIVKDKKDSPRKIDLAVCAVMALSSASQSVDVDVEPFMVVT